MKLYGAAYSRAGRCIWMLEEIGQPYDHVGTSPRGETRTPDMLALNPNGHVPVLDDDGYVIWESLAINQYLAEKTGTLWPAGAQAHGQVAQWSLWAMTEVEPHLVTMLLHMMFLPEAQRSPAAIDQAKGALAAPMKVLDAHLASRPYLLGGDFNVADLNVCSVLGLAAMLQYDFSPFANIGAWLGRCNSRPAAQRYQQKAQEAMAKLG
ncbi:MAG: glutathione S-transferase family protein [Pseudomonadota bacterium]